MNKIERSETFHVMLWVCNVKSIKKSSLFLCFFVFFVVFLCFLCFFCVFLCFCVFVSCSYRLVYKIKRKRCLKLLSLRSGVSGMVYIVSTMSPNNTWMIVLVSSGLSQ